MILSSIPYGILYAGLIGVVLSLLVATWQQKWECKVFFLLALRLAIGWQFFFEGLHKINSHMIGPTETNKPFSSEPYFKVAPTAFGEVMRKKFEDPAAVINERVRAPREVKPGEFSKLNAAEQSACCPQAVAMEFDKISESAEAALNEENDEATKLHEHEIKSAMSDELKALAEMKFNDAVKNIQTRRAKLAAISPTARDDAKVKYAAWVCGEVPRNSKVKFINGDVPYTAPQRLQQLEAIKSRITAELEQADRKRSAGLGLANGGELKRVSELRMELQAAESDLAKDANAFVAELQKDILGWEIVSKTKSQGRRIDEFTMWFITIIGGCLLFGFCTRVNCVLAAGFLVMTYLSHPAFPWYALPPNTEGNPLFINKNLIECLALLVLACYPTGRWLGLDAILHRLFHSRHYLEMEARNRNNLTSGSC